MQKTGRGGGQRLVELLSDRLAQEQVDTLDETLAGVRFCTLD